MDYSRGRNSSRWKALAVSERQSIEPMLEHLSNEGYSMAAIERAFGLPQRTISRWKSNKELTATGLALLRVIRTYPWIIDVADSKYEGNYACVRHIQTAADQLMRLATSAGHSVCAGYGVQTGVIGQPNMFAMGALFWKEDNAKTKRRILPDKVRLESNVNAVWVSR